jgi:hypothetical protein
MGMAKKCVICKKNKAFPVKVENHEFDKCLDCAIKHMNELRTELIAMLSPEQLATLQKYERAVDERLAIQILIDRGFLK